MLLPSEAYVPTWAGGSGWVRVLVRLLAVVARRDRVVVPPGVGAEGAALIYAGIGVVSMSMSAGSSLRSHVPYPMRPPPSIRSPVTAPMAHARG